MEAVAEELRAGSRVPVTIDQIVNDTLVVTLTYRERNYTGILLDCNKKTGLFCLPDFKADTRHFPISTPACEVPEVLSEEPVSRSPSQASHRPKDENSLPESSFPSAPLPCPVPTPVLAGQTPYPPYFEGAPFPQPLWVRHSYSQWVPQPPPRPIKRKKRRTREPGRMTMSTIRLRPRQVLCEKCKNTLNSDEDSKDGMSNTKTSRKENALQSDDDGEDKDTPSKLLRKEDVVAAKDTKRRENGPSLDSKRLRKDKRGEPEGEKFPGGDVIPHSPVIKISYSTPQGKGEVMKIPARVHGSVKPFCPKQLALNGLGENGKMPSDPTKEQRHILDATRSGLTVSIPKLKLTRPYTTVGQDLPSPKIHLRPPQRDGEDGVVEYEAELVGGTRRRSPRVPGPCLPHSDDSGEGKNSLELWSGSSGEEVERGHSDLTLLINFRKRKADSSSLSVCSSDSPRRVQVLQLRRHLTRTLRPGPGGRPVRHLVFRPITGGLQDGATAYCAASHPQHDKVRNRRGSRRCCGRHRVGEDSRLPLVARTRPQHQRHPQTRDGQLRGPVAPGQGSVVRFTHHLPTLRCQTVALQGTLQVPLQPQEERDVPKSNPGGSQGGGPHEPRDHIAAVPQ
ncbi:hypothetical protein KUCAC02_024333 [Chaenocephalus aceratus]|uniref:Uncharacterized protein n=4 Tax=Chaenocephalus aceratus TaxID=36190 RepID=A0ACB9WHP3_CHAAC|nr:hypothetical protein KUCAC02_024333 [Chaenocephalus aceratus]KAI4812975.1 hypothetical protein KUCAC02_024333 [Chaenocephalus aceratus]KAI4812976.1 hypothetical protein KUCAC02_024333 [Chaenocephalus aceratus]KAI4812977.1 hypothetical protein KUCAC02_024333 [Chaenocephalus aceratus]